MKSILFSALLLLFFSQNAMAAGIEFFHGTWPEALEKAKSENKLIFVDAFAVWCGPCKHMAANVFTDPDVGDFFNANFICMKIDMEKAENAEFVGKFPVSAYPTLMFINATGKIVLKEVGAKPAPALLEMGKKALGLSDNLGEMEKTYNDGNRDPQFVLNYVRALNRSGKSSLKVTNDYLATQQDFNTEFNRRFLFEGLVEADSRVFDLVLPQKAAIAELVGQEALDTRLEQACQKTVRKALEFRSPELLKEAKEKMKKAVPAKAEAFAYEADMQYYAAVKDSKNYLKTASMYQKNLVKNNAVKLHALCGKLTQAFPNDPKVLEQAARWEEIAVENGGLPEYYLTLAHLYRQLNRPADAIRIARKGIDAINNKQDMISQRLEDLIRDLDKP